MGKQAVVTDVAALGVDSPDFPKDLMLEALRLKSILNKKVGDDEYDPDFHLARRCDEVMEELAVVQAGAGVECIVGCGMKFRASLRGGKRTLKPELLMQELLGLGLTGAQVAAAMAAATVTGEGFWVREIEKVV